MERDSGTPLASVIIVSYNDEDLIEDCLDSVLLQSLPPDTYEVIVVDNASEDQTVPIIRQRFPQVQLIEAGGNLGYPAGMNRGLQEASGSYAVMLSSDTVVPHKWLEALLEPLQRDPQVKVSHAAMVIPGDAGYEKLAQRNGRRVPEPEAAAYHEMSRAGLIVPHWAKASSDPVSTLHVAGASAAIDLSILDEIGGYMLDGDYFLDCDEIDLGFRVNNLGYRVVGVPAAAYYHRHPFNTQMKPSKRLASRLIRLQRNKAITFYKNMHVLEFIACLPILLIGGALKPLVYADRFNLFERVAAIVGLEVFVWAGFLSAVFGHFPRFAAKRREILKKRKRPAFWFFQQLRRKPPRDLTS